MIVKDHGKYYKKNGVILSRKVSWYWDIRIYLPFLLIIGMLFYNHGGAKEVSMTDVMEHEIAIAETYGFEDTEPVEPSYDERNIIALARLADSVGGHRSDEVKKIIMWVAINRTEDNRNGYGKSLIEEIARPNQWQGYKEDAYYLDSTYLLACQVYDAWKSGYSRPIYPDMLWFVLNNDGSITVRNQFKVGKNRSEMTFGQG